MSPNANIAFVVVRTTAAKLSRMGRDYAAPELASAQHTAKRLSVKGERYTVMTGAEFDARRGVS
jgi:hypothetical protein